MKSFFTCHSRLFLYCSFATIILTLQACVVSGGGGLPNGNVAANGSAQQGNSANMQAAGDPVLLLDQIMLQNLLGQAKINFDANGNLAWENSATGSQGIVSHYIENRTNGKACRNFQTERTAFNGVSLYNGQLCQNANGIWQMTTFQLVQ